MTVPATPVPRGRTGGQGPGGRGPGGRGPSWRGPALGTLLRLGRVSNLPTVWTNALAGAVLATAPAGPPPAVWPLIGVILALTLFYEGGMWLNDAFDADYDAATRNGRPIPAGEIGRRMVAGGGLLLLAAGGGLSFALGPAAGLAGAGLAGAVLLYDWLHKRTRLSPLLMGLTRFLCYILAALAVGEVTGAVIAGGAGLFAWVVGLTYAAKQEAHDRLGAVWPLAVLAAPLLLALWWGGGNGLGLVLWAGLAAIAGISLRRLVRRRTGDVPKAVVTMIAGISLYDAVLIAGTGAPGLALLAAAGVALTLLLQRVAPGT